jgi:hypothetical protein
LVGCSVTVVSPPDLLTAEAGIEMGLLLIDRDRVPGTTVVVASAKVRLILG